ncbi:uncharacterized protein LOC132464355 [Gadus macrocephalus]|uniref:uncharacterized protein LOC132464355 n=1 Tax=Gadus macrocephalus TaxID=80720 RepID=UPI0028CB8F23|nr:uncharacterized protein LOC132464355 [Gadus macrocephalus]
MHFGVVSKMDARNLPKWTPEQTRRLIVFRSQNDKRFTLHKGRAKHLWGILIRDLGLEGKTTPKQIAKKWENLKMKYKLLKADLPDGTGLCSKESYWRWFDLMDRAMTGSLGQWEGPVLGLAPLVEGEESVLSPAPLVEGEGSVLSSVSFVEGEGSVISPVHLANGEGSTLSPTRLVMAECQQWSERGGEGGVTGRQLEREELDREREELDREREELDREREELRSEAVAVETQRAVLEKDTAGVDCEHGVLERERAVLERERAVLERERAVLEQDRAILERERKELAEGRGRGAWHKDRLLCLWERLM